MHPIVIIILIIVAVCVCLRIAQLLEIKFPREVYHEEDVIEYVIEKPLNPLADLDLICKE